MTWARWWISSIGGLLTREKGAIDRADPDMRTGRVHKLCMWYAVGPDNLLMLCIKISDLDVTKLCTTVSLVSC